MAVTQQHAARIDVGARVLVGRGQLPGRPGTPRLVDVGTLEHRGRGYVLVRVRLECKRYALADLTALEEMRPA